MAGAEVGVDDFQLTAIFGLTVSLRGLAKLRPRFQHISLTLKSKIKLSSNLSRCQNISLTFKSKTKLSSRSNLARCQNISLTLKCKKRDLLQPPLQNIVFGLLIYHLFLSVHKNNYELNLLAPRLKNRFWSCP